MVWLVQIRQNLTACDTIFRGGPTQRTLSEHVFESEPEALKFYQGQKARMRVASVAGEYVTYPTEHESYEPKPPPTFFCDECGEGVHLKEKPEDGPQDLGYSDLPNGNFCSRTCFRNSFDKNYDDNYDDHDCGGYDE